MVCFTTFTTNNVFANEQAVSAITIDLSNNWDTMGFKKNKRTEFSLIENTLRIESDSAVAFYYHRLPRLSQISHCPWRLSFSWRVLEARNLSKQSVSKGDDRPLAVHLWVNDPSQFGWFKGTLAKLFSIPTPGYMLTYSWGLTEEWQQAFANPHLPERAVIKVLRAELDIGETWFHETVEISRALEESFGSDIDTRKLYLAISADTEDSKGYSLAEVKDVVLTPTNCQATHDTHE